MNPEQPPHESTPSTPPPSHEFPPEESLATVGEPDAEDAANAKAIEEKLRQNAEEWAAGKEPGNEHEPTVSTEEHPVSPLPSTRPTPKAVRHEEHDDHHENKWITGAKVIGATIVTFFGNLWDWFMDSVRAGSGGKKSSHAAPASSGSGSHGGGGH